MLTNYLLVALGIALNVSAQIALKLSSRGRGELSLAGIAADPFATVLQPWFVVGITLYGIAVINWVIVLSRVDLSIAYALTSMGYILTFIAGVWYFGEQITASRVAGLIVIILGVILITRPVPAHG